MKTSELINRLMESVLKFGDRNVVAEMQIVQNGEPVLGKRVPLLIETNERETKIAFQFAGATPLMNQPVVTTTEPVQHA
jgi:hypothetical protein